MNPSDWRRIGIALSLIAMISACSKKADKVPRKAAVTRMANAACTRKDDCMNPQPNCVAETIARMADKIPDDVDSERLDECVSDLMKTPCNRAPGYAPDPDSCWKVYKGAFE
jgi:hypothetical protein